MKNHFFSSKKKKSTNLFFIKQKTKKRKTQTIQDQTHKCKKNPEWEKLKVLRYAIFVSKLFCPWKKKKTFCKQ